MSTTTVAARPRVRFYVNLARVLVRPEESAGRLGLVELAGLRGEAAYAAPVAPPQPAGGRS